MATKKEMEARVNAVRAVLADGPKAAAEIREALGLSIDQMAGIRKRAGVIAELGGDGIRRWRLDLADDFVATVCTEDTIDLTEQVESQPQAQREKRRIRKLLSKRRRLLSELQGIGGESEARRGREASLAGVEAELAALNVDFEEAD